MVLTDVDRLILANQFEILGKLNEDPSLEELSSHLKSGYSWIYDQSYALHVSPDFDDHDTQIVLNILEVFESIQVSYDKLSDEDKKKISETSIIFPGFDGNNESRFRWFADALYANGNYAHVKSRSNSHMPCIGMYQTMFTKWKSMPNKYELSIEEIKQILD